MFFPINLNHPFTFFPFTNQLALHPGPSAPVDPSHGHSNAHDYLTAPAIALSSDEESPAGSPTKQLGRLIYKMSYVLIFSVIKTIVTF